MAERKPGPVKPPTIELTARPTDGAKGQSSARKTARPARKDPAKPSESTPPPQTSEAPVATSESADTNAAGPNASEAGSANTQTPKSDDTPVEPPKAAAEKPAPTPEPPRAVPPPPPPPPRRALEPRSSMGTVLAAALIGAALGTLLTYLLANVIALPSRGPSFADPSATVADHTARLATLEGNEIALGEQARRTQLSLDATIAQLDTAIADFGTRIAATRADIAPPTDLSDIETRLRTISSRLDAIAAGASSADADALAASLTELEQARDSLSSRLEAIAAEQTTTAASLARLQADLTALQEGLIAEAEATASAPPPAITADGLDAAIRRGRPFTRELSLASTIHPELRISPELAAGAASGLGAPDALARRFSGVVPDMLAARTPDATGNWDEAALDWLKGALAIRPSDETEGDTPDAIMSRLEAAMARQDFTEANALFGKLPAPMSTAAGAVATDTAVWAQADAAVDQLRAAEVAR